MYGKLEVALDREKASARIELRGSERKKVATGGVKVLISDAPAIRGRLLDISNSGCAIMLGQQMPPHTEFRIECQVFFEGAYVSIESQAVAVYSVLSGMDGFRVGVKFNSLDAATAETLSKVMA